MAKKKRPKITAQPGADGKDSAPQYRRIDLTVPGDLLHQLKLVRQITGIPVREWCRWQLVLAAQLELARRPGALWARPGSRVYRLTLDQDGELVPVPIAVTLGGERVWVTEIIPAIFAPARASAELLSLEPELRSAAALCDLSADEPNQVELRGVALPVQDILPRDVSPWRSGIGSLALVHQRERYRERVIAASHARARAAARSSE